MPRKPLSEEHRRKLSEIAIRAYANGRQPWNIGKRMSPEYGRKISEARKGMVLSQEHRQHISDSWKGLTEEEKKERFRKVIRGFEKRVTPKEPRKKPKRSNWARGWLS